MINIRTKGQSGEREIASLLNAIVQQERVALGLPRLAIEDEPFQRNQNQSAVGGDDLTNPYKLSIEVKRQEALSVNTWWKQTAVSASRTNGVPILLFRQNRKKWRCVMLADLPLVDPSSTTYASYSFQRVEVEIDVFKEWFRQYYLRWVRTNA